MLHRRAATAPGDRSLQSCHATPAYRRSITTYGCLEALKDPPVLVLAPINRNPYDDLTRGVTGEGMTCGDPSSRCRSEQPCCCWAQRRRRPMSARRSRLRRAASGSRLPQSHPPDPAMRCPEASETSRRSWTSSLQGCRQAKPSSAWLLSCTRVLTRRATKPSRARPSVSERGGN
jgi:hypothetical protein